MIEQVLKSEDCPVVAVVGDIGKHEPMHIFRSLDGIILANTGKGVLAVMKGYGIGKRVKEWGRSRGFSVEKVAPRSEKERTGEEMQRALRACLISRSNCLIVFTRFPNDHRKIIEMADVMEIPVKVVKTPNRHE